MISESHLEKMAVLFKKDEEAYELLESIAHSGTEANIPDETVQFQVGNLAKIARKYKGDEQIKVLKMMDKVYYDASRNLDSYLNGSRQENSVLDPSVLFLNRIKTSIKSKRHLFTVQTLGELMHEYFVDSYSPNIPASGYRMDPAQKEKKG